MTPSRGVSFRSAGVIVMGCAAIFCSACAMTRYQPAPQIPADSAAAFEARSLGDPALRAFTATALGRETEPWPPAAWDPAHLTAAALYYHPDVTVARAAMQVAEAGP